MTTLHFAIAVGLKLFLMVFFVFNMGALLTWNDRRQSAMMQDRVGPNRAVLKIFGIELRIIGLLHTAADGLKFFFKEDFTPPKADKLLFGLAPILALAPVIALTGVIPMTDSMCLDSMFEIAPRTGAVCTEVLGGAVAPLDVGLLFVFAISGQGVVAAAIAGWASDNKFSLMGSLRAASQMVSYEIAIGLALVGAFMTYGTVRLEEMVRWQGENSWGIFVQPLGFVLYFVSAVAETKRIPFDLPEAESELVAGYMTEYAGMKFGMFYFAEYMEVVTSSMLLVTIFLGGWQLPVPAPRWHQRRLRRQRAVRPPAAAGRDDRARCPGVLRQDHRPLRVPGVRALEPAALPLRPADAARLEGAAPARPRQRVRHWRHPPRGAERRRDRQCGARGRGPGHPARGRGLLHPPVRPVRGLDLRQPPQAHPDHRLCCDSSSGARRHQTLPHAGLT